ncbi:hypothetical protein JS756_22410 [Streptomyces actuosus]|uniref:DinB-like domain-containing protein n=1 Tax=Streptomyces actuosus TaxID=1885 RepID=A0ABS2VUK3_STRAS|nr:hypothetical protein [Streptomyces actuosus]MBN0046812.1 hypothetical protein [Streptomyces actuosus]
MNLTASALPSPPRLPAPECTRCSFTSETCDRYTAADLLLHWTTGWQRVLTGPGTARHCAGAPAWSVLEHGCHVRDMCLLFHQQLDAIFGTARPIAPSSVTPEPPPSYHEEDALRVAGELGRAAAALAGRLAALTADEWEHEDPRLPDLRLTVGLLTRHLLHDISHSLHDALRGIREHDAVTGTAHRQDDRKAAGSHG